MGSGVLGALPQEAKEGTPCCTKYSQRSSVKQAR